MKEEKEEQKLKIFIVPDVYDVQLVVLHSREELNEIFPELKDSSQVHEFDCEWGIDKHFYF